MVCPQITINLTDNGPLCEGETLVITPTITGATLPITYSWSDASSQSTLTETNPTNGAYYTLDIVDNFGCVDSANSPSITVYAEPTATITAASACVGDDITLTEGAGDAVMWNWTIVSGNYTISDPADANPIISNASSGDMIQVEITDINGCTAIDVFTIDLIDLPMVSINVNGGGCVGEAIEVSLAAPSNSTIDSYNLQGSPSIAYNGSNGYPSWDLTYANPGTYSITVIVLSNGCTGTATANVTISDFPSVDLEADPVCEGESFTLTANTGLSTGLTYQWSDSNGVIPNETSSTLTGVAVANTEYFVSVTNSFGCTTTDSEIQIVNPVPEIELSQIPVCAGEDVVIQSTAINGSTFNYNWSISGGTAPILTGVDEDEVSIASLSGGEIIILSVTNEFGCTTTDSIAIEFIPAPVIELFDITGCQNELLEIAVSFSNASIAGYNLGDADAYLGSFLGNQIWEVTYPNAGMFSASVTIQDNTTGCTATATNEITIFESPMVTINSMPACEGSIATLQATPGFANYIWSDANGIIMGENSSDLDVVIDPTNLDFTLTAVGDNGCETTISYTITTLPNPIVTADTTYVCDGLGPIQLVGMPSGGTFTSNSITGPTFDPSTSGNYPYTYTYTDPSTGCTSSANGLVVITDVPDVVLNDAQACLGDLALVTSSFTGQIVGFSDGGAANFSSAGNQSWNVTYTQPGVYDIFITVNENGCTATDSAQVVIFDGPGAMISSNSPICKGDDLQMFTYGVANATYNWEIITGCGTLSNPTLANPSITDISNCPNGLEVCVTITNTDTGCDSIYCLIPEIIDVTASASSTNICSGTNLILNASGISSNPNANCIFLGWLDQQGDTISTDVMPTLMPNNSNIYTAVYSCDGIECTDNVFVDVSGSNSNIAILNANQTVCNGDSVSLFAIGSNIDAYTWTVNGIPQSFTDSLAYIPADEDSVCVTVVTDQGCEISSCTEIEVITTPTINFTLDTDSICQGGSIILTLDPASLSPTANYTFNMGGALVSPIGGGVYELTFTQSGLFPIAVYANENGCQSEIAAEIIYVCNTPMVSIGNDLIFTANTPCFDLQAFIAPDGNNEFTFELTGSSGMVLDATISSGTILGTSAMLGAICADDLLPGLNQYCLTVSNGCGCETETCIAVTYLEGVTCDDALVIDGCEATVTLDSIPSGIGSSAIYANSTVSSAWYSYTALADGSITVSSCVSDSVDTVLGIHDFDSFLNDCNNIDVTGYQIDVDVNDDFCGLGAGSELNYPVLAGNTYLIEWADANSNDGFTWDLTFECNPAAFTAIPNPANPTNELLVSVSQGSSLLVTNQAGNIIASIANPGVQVIPSLGSGTPYLITVVNDCLGDGCGANETTIEVSTMPCEGPEIEVVSVDDVCANGELTVSLNVLNLGTFNNFSIVSNSIVGTFVTPVNIAGPLDIVTTGLSVGDVVTYNILTNDTNCDASFISIMFNCPTPEDEQAYNDGAIVDEEDESIETVRNYYEIIDFEDLIDISQLNNHSVSNDDDNNGSTVIADEAQELVKPEIGSERLGRISQNAPNPFVSTTSISYEINYAYTTAQIVVMDITGKQLSVIRLTNSDTGINSVDYNGDRLISGIYNYVLIVDGVVKDAKKMIKQ